MNAQKKIAIGCDHTGINVKNAIIFALKQENYEIIDCGTNSLVPVDYPDVAKAVAQKVSNKNVAFGIVICGTGIGVSIAANKVANIRCALVYEEITTKLAREHNDANIIALGARIIAVEKAIILVKLFLTTKFSSEKRHQQRIIKLDC